MNQVISLVRSARESTDPNSRLYSDHMLSELLFLHEEMIVQLCVERLEAASNIEFLDGMIAQYEASAEMIRAHLEGRKVPTTSPIPSDATTAPENLRFPSESPPSLPPTPGSETGARPVD